jgi:hypothetical protein
VALLLYAGQLWPWKRTAVRGFVQVGVIALPRKEVSGHRVNRQNIRTMLMTRVYCGSEAWTERRQISASLLGHTLFSNHPSMQLTTAHKIDATSTPVHAVTVFRSACAEVIRKFTIALKVRRIDARGRRQGFMMQGHSMLLSIRSMEVISHATHLSCRLRGLGSRLPNGQ